MKTHRTTATVALAILGLALAAGQLHAQGVGNVSSLPNVFPADPAVGGWVIGQYGVVRDPNGGPWVKNLVNPNGGNIIAQPGQTFTLQESLFIAGNLSWSDWHEQILTPGWDWLAPAAFWANGSPAPGLSISHTPGSPTSGGTLDFFFNSLPPGTKIDIRKQLQYVGGATGVPFDGIVKIAEFPTPEPATALFLAIGGAILFRGRRRAVRD